MAHGKRILCGLNRAADLYRFNDDAVAVTGGRSPPRRFLSFVALAYSPEQLVEPSSYIEPSGRYVYIIDMT